MQTNSLVILRGVPMDHLTKVNWVDLSPSLQRVYGKRDALFAGGKEVAVEWEGDKITARAGFISDLASIPWWLRLIGISRYDGTGWRDLGAYLHDGVCRGAAKFSSNDRENLDKASRLLLACWLWARGDCFEVWRDYYAMKAFVRFHYKPQPALHADGVFTIEPILKAT